ncbi:MAG: type IX secretion system membrane protein PorP/SprF, partial [Saprospiraceae bacterium]
VYRNQFIGLDGAPKTVALSFNMPYNGERLAFGINLVQHSIGITRILNLDLIPFAYLIPMRYGTLSFGIQVGIRQFSQNWGDKRIEVVQTTGDVAIPTEDNTKILVNPGAGVFYKSDHWYAGVALPRILHSNIDFSTIGAGDDISHEVWHFNAMGGYTFTPNDNLTITPQTLLKYAQHAPFEADINLTLLLKNKFSGGITYRTGGGETSAAGESIDFLLGLQATEKLFFCLSYDLGLTSLRRSHHGSAELTARYWFNPPAASADNPVSPY